VEIGIINPDTVKVMIAKASAHEKKINRILTGEPEEEAPVEEVKEEKVEKKEEVKEGAGAEGLASLFG
jgi:hypothetical protein